MSQFEVESLTFYQVTSNEEMDSNFSDLNLIWIRWLRMIEVSLTAVHFAWVKWFSYLFATGWLRNCRCGDDRQISSWQLRWYRFDGCGSRRRRRCGPIFKSTAILINSFQVLVAVSTGNNKQLTVETSCDGKQTEQHSAPVRAVIFSLSLSLSLTHSLGEYR